MSLLVVCVCYLYKYLIALKSLVFVEMFGYSVRVAWLDVYMAFEYSQQKAVVSCNPRVVVFFSVFCKCKSTVFRRYALMLHKSFAVAHLKPEKESGYFRN